MFKKFICFFIILSIVSAVMPAFTVCVSAETSDYAFFNYLTERLKNYEERIDFSYYAKVGGWNLKTVADKVKEYYLETPELFFVNNKNMVIEYDESNYIYKIRFEYLYNKNQSEKMLKRMRQAAAEAVKGITDDMSDAEKALVVHDYIVLNNSYDQSDSKRSAYNCLVEHSSVCQGYTLAFTYIMRDILGIDCSFAVSESQNHVWNYIKIGNDWFHVDLTADDPSYFTYGGKKYDGAGEVLHTNFLMDDSECIKSNDLHKNFKVSGHPAATNSKYNNYFWKESLSAMFKYNGLWYYAVVDSNCSGLNYKKGKDHVISTMICTYDFETGESNTIDEIEATWYLYRDSSTGKKLEKTSWYKRSYLKLVLYGNSMYYNTTDSIYHINLKTGKTKKVYTLNKKGMSIYSITASDKKLMVCYKRDMSYKGNYISLNVKT